MENKFKILIDRSAYRFGVDIRIGLYSNGVLYVAEPIKLVFNPHDPYKASPPTLELPEAHGLPFLDALKTALEDHHGIREGHVEGELKAAKEHLKDMRMLAFQKVGLRQEMQPTIKVDIPRR